MTIAQQDIKFLASQRMDDTSEGGGRVTGNAIADGAENSIFPDISDLDRDYGRVKLRKVFQAVLSPDRDAYFGANAIIVQPPADDKVSLCMMSTGDHYDVRFDAQDRIESYQVRGPKWQGYLYDTQLAGQRAIRFIQRTNVRLPEVGEVLCLIANEGAVNELEQYVRITKVSAQNQVFLVSGYGSEFTRTVVTAEIGAPLRHTFYGGQPTPYDTSAGSTTLRETVAADTTKYYGTAEIAEAARFGDLSLRAASVFTQLVPSARSEVPAVNLHPAGYAVGAIQAGSQKASATLPRFSAGQQYFLGAAITPGSLSLNVNGNELSDKDGQLWLGTAAVGNIDYAGGVISSAANAPSTTSPVVASYYAAHAPQAVAETAAIGIEANNRGYAYTMHLSPPPAKGSLKVSFMAQGKWYDLFDNGSGEIKGADSSYGSGLLSGDNVMLTLGALPDVGSAVLFSWAQDTTTAADVAQQDLAKLAFTIKLTADGAQPVNDSAYSSATTDAVRVYQEATAGGTGSYIAPPPQTVVDASCAVAANGITVTWDDGSKSATCDANGNFSGDGSGTVNVRAGLISIMPHVLPTKGQQVNVSWQNRQRNSQTRPSYNLTGNVLTFSVPADADPETLEVVLIAQRNLMDYEASFGRKKPTERIVLRGANFVEPRSNQSLGSLSGTTATINLPSTLLFNVPQLISASVNAEGTKPYYRLGNHQLMQAGYQLLDVLSLSSVNQSGSTPKTAQFACEELVWVYQDRANGLGGLIAQSMGCSVNNTVLKASAGELLATDPLTGATSIAGRINSGQGVIVLTQWQNGGNPNCAVAALINQASEHVTDHAEFKTPGAPVAPGSLFVQLVDEQGQSHNVTVSESGLIGSGIFHGSFDHQTGVARIRFAQKVLATDYPSGLNQWYRPEDIDGQGYVLKPHLVRLDSIRFNCVSYNYLPLEAQIIQLDPVRLPSDGRVPVIRKGDLVVVHHQAQINVPNPSAGQQINCNRVRLSDVRLTDANGVQLPSTLYSADLNAGVVTLATPLDLAPYALPLTLEHRIEDRALATDVEIGGRIQLSRALSHDYPLGSFVSSALIFGDLQSRIGNVFDQQTWTNEWQDHRIGNDGGGQYNDADYPITISNDGGITERWAIVFQTPSTFVLRGEHVGQIASGSVNEDFAPINPNTSKPYFTIKAQGWGAGWSSGNVLRLNSTGAIAPLWLIQTIMQSTTTITADTFALQARGNVNA